VKTRYSIALMMLVCALGISLAACGSSGSTSSSTSAPSPSADSPSASSAASASASATGGNAVAEITANWIAFFNPKTPMAKRVSLIQNGQAFASSIQTSAGFPGASSASATVSKVTLTSATQASVTYSILLLGTPVPGLTNTKGVAVLENGTWKVGDASFCVLLTLENGGKPPAVCKSAA
jgi:ABC-type phosphate transport system substrate-binding protein